MLANPQQLRQREAGHGGIAGELDQPPCPQRIGQGTTLFLGPLIAPDDRWTNYLIALVQNDGSMHLACQPDRANQAGGAGCLEHLLCRHPSGPPPVVRVLLGPADLR